MTDSNPAIATFYTRDSGLSLLRIEGEDATRFLDAQLATALGEEADKAACPAALANAKGRVLAVFHAWPVKDGWHIAAASSQIEWLMNHFKRLVFRSKVGITQEAELALVGLCGSQASAALAAAKLPAPPPGQLAHSSEVDVVGLVGERWLVVGNSATLSRLAQLLSAHIACGNADDWTRARLAANEVEIRDETRDRFLPQMLGLVELDAVSFRKGCYPGQEIIARARRGNIKRELALLQLDNSATAKAGTALELGGKRMDVLDSVTLCDNTLLVQAVTSP